MRTYRVELKTPKVFKSTTLIIAAFSIEEIKKGFPDAISIKEVEEDVK